MNCSVPVAGEEIGTLLKENGWLLEKENNPGVYARCRWVGIGDNA